MFSTDGDFWVNPDGLQSFISSRLVDDILKFRFRVDVIPLGGWDERQFIRLSVERPWNVRGTKDGHIPGSSCFYHPDAWTDEAMEQVLLPAYMLIFAEIGIGNSHGVSSYFRTDVFDMVDRGTIPVCHWLKSGFTDGVRVLPRAETMSGNYGGSWAQLRFVLGDAKDNGDPRPYIDSVVGELEEALHGEEE